MENTGSQNGFQVELIVYLAGPVREGRKSKGPQILRGEKTITLPFVPYPGLRLTISKPGRRDWPLDAHLRVRTVDWLVNEGYFSCVVDEVSLGVSDASEVRGKPLNQMLFSAVGTLLKQLQFKMSSKDHFLTHAFGKNADGSTNASPAPESVASPSPFKRRLGGFPR